MEWPHVVRVRQSVVFVESMLEWQELFVVAQMPLAETGGRVPFLFCDLRDRRFLLVNADFGRRT